MHPLVRSCFALSLLAFAMPAVPASAQQMDDAPMKSDARPSTDRDGQRDFDWEIGRWETRLKRRLHPLTGSDDWAEYAGTTVVREALGGRANLAELDVRGAAGHIEGLSLRLYHPEARQWSLHYANIASGILTVPTIGAFNDGRGEFYAADTLDGRVILVRFVISGITADSAHFEQAFSDDGGRTWETNWIATDTRVESARMESE